MEVVAAGVCACEVGWSGGASLPSSDGVWEPGCRGEEQLCYQANFLAITESIWIFFIVKFKVWMLGKCRSTI